MNRFIEMTRVGENRGPLGGDVFGGLLRLLAIGSEALRVREAKDLRIEFDAL